MHANTEEEGDSGNNEAMASGCGTQRNRNGSESEDEDELAEERGLVDGKIKSDVYDEDEEFEGISVNTAFLVDVVRASSCIGVVPACGILPFL